MENKFNFKDEDIDPEILQIVKNFNMAGIKTLFSCQGHFKESNNSGVISFPYITAKLPNNDFILTHMIHLCEQYPMIILRISHQVEYDEKIEKFTECDCYIKLLDRSLDELKNNDSLILEFRVNPIMYNLAKELYEHEECYEKTFDYLRKRFLYELFEMSSKLLDIRLGRNILINE